MGVVGRRPLQVGAPPVVPVCQLPAYLIRLRVLTSSDKLRFSTTHDTHDPEPASAPFDTSSGQY